MKMLLCAARSVFAAGLASVVIRILFGLYSVFGPPALIAPAVFGIAAALFLIPKSCDRFFGEDLSHMVLVTVIFALTDHFGIFCTVGTESASFFSDTFGRTASGEILISILCITAADFASLIAASIVIASLHGRRLRKTYEI